MNYDFESRTLVVSYSSNYHEETLNNSDIADLYHWSPFFVSTISQVTIMLFLCSTKDVKNVCQPFLKFPDFACCPSLLLISC